VLLAPPLAVLVPRLLVADEPLQPQDRPVQPGQLRTDESVEPGPTEAPFEIPTVATKVEERQPQVCVDDSRRLAAEYLVEFLPYPVEPLRVHPPTVDQQPIEPGEHHSDEQLSRRLGGHCSCPRVPLPAADRS